MKEWPLGGDQLSIYTRRKLVVMVDVKDMIVRGTLFDCGRDLASYPHIAYELGHPRDQHSLRIPSTHST